MGKEELYKVYKQRNAILKERNCSQEEFLELLEKLGIQFPESQEILRTCEVAQEVRPELFIESVLQRIYKNRVFKYESEFLQRTFSQSSVDWTFFKSEFQTFFQEKYDKKEVYRIIQFVKKFGLESHLVDKHYFKCFVGTCRGTGSQPLKYKSLFFTLEKILLRSAWQKVLPQLTPPVLKDLQNLENLPPKPLLSMKSPQNQKILHEKLLDLTKTFQEQENFNTEDTLSFSSMRLNTKSFALRNKIFYQAFSKFVGSLQHLALQEAFGVIQKPFKNALVRRSLALVYIKLDRAYRMKLLSHFKIWKQPSVKKCQTLLIHYSLKNIFTKKLSTHWNLLKKLQTRSKVLRRLFNRNTFKAKLTLFKKWQSYTAVFDTKKKLKSGFFSTINRLKLSNTNISKKGCFQKLESVLTKKQYTHLLKKWLKWKQVTSKKSKSVSPSVKVPKHKRSKTNTKSPKTTKASSKPFASRFASPYQVSRKSLKKQTPRPKLYFESKNSVKKIRFHHAFEKLILIQRMIQKRTKLSQHIAFNYWKNSKKKSQFSLNLSSLKHFNFSSEFPIVLNLAK